MAVFQVGGPGRCPVIHMTGNGNNAGGPSKARTGRIHPSTRSTPDSASPSFPCFTWSHETNRGGGGLSTIILTIQMGIGWSRLRSRVRVGKTTARPQSNVGSGGRPDKEPLTNGRTAEGGCAKKHVSVHLCTGKVTAGKLPFALRVRQNDDGLRVTGPTGGEPPLQKTNFDHLRVDHSGDMRTNRHRDQRVVRGGPRPLMVSNGLRRPGARLPDTLK